MRLRIPNKADGSRGDQLIDENFVTPGTYRTVPEVFEAMNKALARDDETVANWYDIQMSYNKVTKRTVVGTKKKTKDPITDKPITNRRSIRLTGDLATVLGFNVGGIIKSDRTTTSPYAATPMGGLINIHVYCDAIEQSYMANELTNIFAMISRKYDLERSSLHVPFENPVWHKLENGANIESIQFTITDMSGQPFAFYDGVTTVGIQIKRDDSNEN